METTVRPAQLTDAPRLSEINVLAWQQAYPGLLPAEFLDNLQPMDRAEWWHQAIATPPTGTEHFVAERDGTVMGYVTIGDEHDNGGNGEIYQAYVHPDAWRLGIGSAIMPVALDALRARYSEAIVLTLPENVRARSFYEKHGFVDDNHTEVEHVYGVSALNMRYRLRFT